MVYAFAMGDCNLMGDQFDKDCVHWGKELNIFNINDLEQVYKDIQKCCLSGYKDEVYQSIELLHPITYIRKISQNDLEISVEDYVKKQLYSEENVKKWKNLRDNYSGIGKTEPRVEEIKNIYDSIFCNKLWEDPINMDDEQKAAYYRFEEFMDASH